MTVFWLTSAFLIGYVYARLSRDEFARRKAYIRYTNAMILFDSFSKVYEHHWNRFVLFLTHFDSTYYMWRLKQMKYSEWRVRRSLEKEILGKQSKDDEVSQIIMQLDDISDRDLIRKDK